MVILEWFEAAQPKYRDCAVRDTRQSHKLVRPESSNLVKPPDGSAASTRQSPRRVFGYSATGAASKLTALEWRHQLSVAPSLYRLNPTGLRRNTSVYLYTLGT